MLVLVLLAACAEHPRDQPKPAAIGRSEAVAPAVAVEPEKPVATPVRLFASRFVAKVRVEPHREAQRIGYLRGGAVMQAMTADPVGFDKCRKGWFALDTSGFVCATIDAIPFAGKRLPERQPLQPDLTVALPYPYGLSVRNAPMFRRLPSDAEAVQYENNPNLGRGTLDPALAALVAMPSVAPSEGPAAPAAKAGRLHRDAPPAPPPIAANEAEPLDPNVPTLASLVGDESSLLMRRMQRGFYVSLDRELEKGNRKYWRTQSNGFIPSKALSLVHGSDFHGMDLKQQGITLPVAFVMSKKASAYKLGARGSLQAAGQPGYHYPLRLSGSAEIHGVHYAIDDGGLHYRDKDLRRIELRERPDEVRGDEKWIDVDLETQSLVAYIGAEPVYATLISSGRIRDELDPLRNFESPSGSFRIKSKHLTATMDGDHAIDGPYSIEDVPYVMYFQLAYALHSAFWHDSFGRPHSHGCINLAPIDAKWVFEFAEPELPKGWHGVYPTPQKLGTRLYIHGMTPQG